MSTKPSRSNRRGEIDRNLPSSEAATDGVRSELKRTFTGQLLGYRFTKRFWGQRHDCEWVYFVPEVLLDGTDEPVGEYFFLGDAAHYEISDDGQHLSMAFESPVNFGFSTPFGLLMSSLLDAAERSEGAERGKSELEASLPNLEEGEPLTLASLVGRRFRFKQEVDEDATKKRGKRAGVRIKTIIDAVLDRQGSANSSKSALGATGGKQGTDGEASKREVEEAIVALLNVAVVRRDDAVDVPWICTVCGGSEENHRETCPIPALEELIHPLGCEVSEAR